MRHILCINPTTRDHRELQHVKTYINDTCMYHTIADYTVSFDITHTYMPLDTEIERICEVLSDIPLDGIFATNDYPGQSVASVIAHELGLPGPDPSVLLPLQDKYYARKLASNVIPECIPDFETIAPEHPELSHVSLPCIIKPIKGVGSLGTMLIRNEAELAALAAIPDLFFQPLHDLLTQYTDHNLSDNVLLAESCASGLQVTVDGYVYNGSIQIMGIVDSDIDPQTLQFHTFTYPSQLETHIQNRIKEVVTILVQATKLNNTCFNVECRYDPEYDRITIIEMNTRMSSQFADMYEKVDGYHPYQVAIDLACGTEPEILHQKGKYKKACGFCIHTNADYFVDRVPTPDEKETLLAEIPDMRIEVEVSPGKRMSACDDAVFVYGYTMLQIGGDSDEELKEKFDHARTNLPFRFSK